MVEDIKRKRREMQLLNSQDYRKENKKLIKYRPESVNYQRQMRKVQSEERLLYTASNRKNITENVQKEKVQKFQDR